MITYHWVRPLEITLLRKPLPVVVHLPGAEAGRRYRTCPDPKAKTRWHLIGLLLRSAGPASCKRADPRVGLSDVHARTVLKRWNAHGLAWPTRGRPTAAVAG